MQSCLAITGQWYESVWLCAMSGGKKLVVLINYITSNGSNFREAFTLIKLTVLGHVSLLTISKTTLSLQLNTNFLKMLLLTVSYEE